MEGRVTGLGPLELKYVLAFLSLSKLGAMVGLTSLYGSLIIRITVPRTFHR